MKNQRYRFLLSPGSIYLNCAYMSPLMKQVERAGIKGMQVKRNPINISAEDFFSDTETVRHEYAKLIGATNPKRIVVVPSASYGLSTIARNTRVGRGDSIVVIQEEFPSNIYSWKRLAADSGATLNMVTPPESLTGRGKAWNERLIDSIKPGTKLVAMGNVHWADGTRFNLEEVRKRTRDVGARLVVDGTQTVGALPFDVGRLQPDALICAAYKWLMGPYSIGLAYFDESFDDGTPIEENWMNRLGSEDFAGLVKYQDRYQPGALRYEVGEHSNFIMIPMMIEALRQVNNWGPKNVQAYCMKITANGVRALRDRGCWIEEEESRGHHLFGIRFSKGFDLERIRNDIKRKRISVSFRGDSMRVSPHVYNSEEEFLRLVKIIVKP